MRRGEQPASEYTFSLFAICDFLEDGFGFALVCEDDANHAILIKNKT